MPRFQLKDLPDEYQRQVLAQIQDRNSGPVSDPEPDPESGPQTTPAAQGEEQKGIRRCVRRVVVRIISRRVKLCDADALVPKWYIDRLTANDGGIGVIKDDTLEFVRRVEFEQEKCRKGDEATIIEVWEEDDPLMVAFPADERDSNP